MNYTSNALISNIHIEAFELKQSEVSAKIEAIEYQIKEEDNLEFICEIIHENENQEEDLQIIAEENQFEEDFSTKHDDQGNQNNHKEDEIQNNECNDL